MALVLSIVLIHSHASSAAVVNISAVSHTFGPYDEIVGCIC